VAAPWLNSSALASLDAASNGIYNRLLKLSLTSAVASGSAWISAAVAQRPAATGLRGYLSPAAGQWLSTVPAHAGQWLSTVHKHLLDPMPFIGVMAAGTW
jgi:hypothetical protein